MKRAAARPSFSERCCSSCEHLSWFNRREAEMRCRHPENKLTSGENPAVLRNGLCGLFEFGFESLRFQIFARSRDDAERSPH